MMRVARLQNALERLSAAICDFEAELAVMEAEHDPLASHIFISRRHYRNAQDTKGGKRREMNARLTFNTACELGFRGGLDEWHRLLGAVARRYGVFLTYAMYAHIRKVAVQFWEQASPAQQANLFG